MGYSPNPDENYTLEEELPELDLEPHQAQIDKVRDTVLDTLGLKRPFWAEESSIVPKCVVRVRGFSAAGLRST